MVKFGKFPVKKEKGQLFIEASLENYLEVLDIMAKKNARLIDVSGLEDEKLKVVYHFDVENKILHIIVPISAKNPKIKSICSLFPAAELYERELQEMFGIGVENHPDMRPLFLPDELVGKAPMRRRTAK